MLDMVFGELDALPMRKNGLHRLGITGDFLFVARSELLDFKTCEQLPDFLVAQFGTLDPGRGADAFDGRNATQRAQPLR